MGKIITPKHRLIMDGTMMSWDGRVSEDRLRDYVFAYAKSLESGGINEHISKALGHIPYPTQARIETNTKNPVIRATWKAAMFQVY